MKDHAEIDSPQRKNLDGSGELVAVSVSQLLEHDNAPDYKGVHLISLIMIFLGYLIFLYEFVFFSRITFQCKVSI